MLELVNNWRLSRKMLVAFSFIGALLGGLAITGIIANEKLHDIATVGYHRGIEGSGALSDVLSSLREYRIIIYSHMTAQSPDERAGLEERFARNKASLNEAVEAYAQTALARLGDESDERIDETKVEVEKLKSAVATLNAANERIIDASRRAGFDGAIGLVKRDGKEASHAAIKQAEDLLDEIRETAHQRDEAGDVLASNEFYFSIALTLLSLGGLLLVWRLMGRTVSTPMAELSHATTTLAQGGNAEVPSRGRADELGEIAKAVELFRQAAVARAEADAKVAAEQKLVTSSLAEGLAALTAGDLTVEIKAEFPAAYAELKTNFNAALASLRALIGAVSEGAAGIQTGSQEITQASEDLARRTEANAASLEETSAALVQIDGRLKATAEAASRTVARADEAIATVGDGRTIADGAVQAMNRVRESAKGIDEVIEGVDKIAFQTRVLAMNAAVEAGRAGEAGRGFAVVADLVSALAMRAEEEAKKAREQLTVTQADIGTAVEAVEKVDGALQNISGDVGEVHVLLGTMAQDNQAQSSAISQISVAIRAMDQSTQQNAAMVEETSAAAGNLMSEVGSLTEHAGQFKVAGGARPAAAVPPVKLPQPRGKAPAYVSPVKPLPAPAKANGTTGMAAAEDWNEF